MDIETKEMLNAILTKITGVEQKITGVEQKITGVEQKITGMEQDLSEVKKLSTKTAIIQENEVAKKIQLIYENQVSIIGNNAQLKTLDTRVETLETQVSALNLAYKLRKQA